MFETILIAVILFAAGGCYSVAAEVRQFRLAICERVDGRYKMNMERDVG
jgi:hypothetical protein